MGFCIHAVISDHDSEWSFKCEIQIDDFRETCPLIDDLWTVDQYRNQWLEAARALCSHKVRKAMLITDIRPKDISAAVVFWALYAENDLIYIHEVFIRDADQATIADPVVAEEYILERNDSSDEDDEYAVSEWTIKLSDLADFISGGDEGARTG